MNDKPPPTQWRFYPLLERHQAIMEGSDAGLFPREIGQDLDVRRNMQGGQDLDSWSRAGMLNARDFVRRLTPYP